MCGKPGRHRCGLKGGGARGFRAGREIREGIAGYVLMMLGANLEAAMWSWGRDHSVCGSAKKRAGSSWETQVLGSGMSFMCNHAASVCSLDINECLSISAPCPIGQTCINTEGSYTCQKNVPNCGRGYHLNEEGTRCVGWY